MHCYAFIMLYLKDGRNALLCFHNVVSQRLKKEFRMHCYAFIMLYLKDGPLRSSNYFFAKCML